MPTSTTPDRAQRALIEEAARILDEHGSLDFHLAKRKAARRLGYSEHGQLPSNADIETALRQRQQLFSAAALSASQAEQLHACEAAMQFFTAFKPKLAGALLAGIASKETAIELHLFADQVETLQMHLHDARIPFQLGQRDLRFSTKSHQTIAIPEFSIDADGMAFALLLFDERCPRQAPLCPIQQRPQQRASIDEVRALLLTAK